MKLIVATSQFPISADIRANLRHVLEQMRSARAQGARVIHFPEAALSGYAGSDFDSYVDFDWDLLAEATQHVLERAVAFHLWVILGTAPSVSCAPQTAQQPLHYQ